jgi:hypothetical protein
MKKREAFSPEIPPFFCACYHINLVPPVGVVEKETPPFSRASYPMNLVRSCGSRWKRDACRGVIFLFLVLALFDCGMTKGSNLTLQNMSQSAIHNTDTDMHHNK